MKSIFRRTVHFMAFNAAAVAFFIFLMIVGYAGGTQTEIFAKEYTADASVLALSNTQALRDGQVSTYYLMDPGEILTVKTENTIAGVYLEFYSQSALGTVTTANGTKFFGASGYLHEYITLEKAEAETLEIVFTSGAKLSELRIFGAGTLPPDVQVWSPPYERADALLLTPHGDDEHLFFAGALPWMIAQGYDCQVAYFCSHAQNPIRLHEQLNGLWAVGMTHYPVFGVYPDYYSESIQQALAKLSADGYTEEDLIGYQVELLRRFKPYVVVGPDTNGEYGHGAHMLNAHVLQQALEVSGDGDAYPQSFRLYGVWDVPKAYLHLWNERKIVMNFDLPLEYYGGKTAYEMSVAGYMCHKSQHWTWFTEWLIGTKSKPLESAAQIQYYSPCMYGLYRSTVGDDTLKNDFFEHILFEAEQPTLSDVIYTGKAVGTAVVTVLDGASASES